MQGLCRGFCYNAEGRQNTRDHRRVRLLRSPRHQRWCQNSFWLRRYRVSRSEGIPALETSFSLRFHCGERLRCAISHERLRVLTLLLMLPHTGMIAFWIAHCMHSHCHCVAFWVRITDHQDHAHDVDRQDHRWQGVTWSCLCKQMHVHVTMQLRRSASPITSQETTRFSKNARDNA